MGDSPLTFCISKFFKGKILGFDDEATHPSFLCADQDLSWEGRCEAPGLATLHSTLGVFAFPKSCFSIERSPIRFFVVVFVLWHQMKVAWKSMQIPFISQCVQWSNYSKPNRLSKDIQKKSSPSILLDGFLAAS